MTNLEYLQSLEPEQLKAWFDSEHSDNEGLTSEFENLQDACDKYKDTINHLTNAVAIYRGMFEDDAR